MRLLNQKHETLVTVAKRLETAYYSECVKSIPSLCEWAGATSFGMVVARASDKRQNLT